MLHPARCLFAAAWAFILAGCTGSSMMGIDVSDYRAMFNSTGDEQILVNILRARDNAPLHFTELATLGASLQITSSLQGTDPIGAPNGSTSRASIQGTFGLQNNPSFQLSSLELQQFTQGLMNPVTPDIIQQLFEEGIDQRLILLLFFSGITTNGVTYLNNTRCDQSEANCYRHLYDYLDEVEKLNRHKIVANIYQELTPIGPPVPSTSSTIPGIKDLAGIDTQKYSVEYDPITKTTVIFSISEKRLALCKVSSFGGPRLLPLLSGGQPGICTHDRVYAWSNRFSKLKPSNGLIVRSAYQIIEYLGQVLDFQEKTAHDNRCIKLSGDKHHRSCDETDVLFQVNPHRGSTLVMTVYRGWPYTVGVGRCLKEYCDHSPEVLKILNLLININKNAANIPIVPFVRTIQ